MGGIIKERGRMEGRERGGGKGTGREGQGKRRMESVTGSERSCVVK